LTQRLSPRAEIRAKRRYDELLIQGEEVSLKDILKNLNDRDSHDVNRRINPLVKAKDAILIDNSNLSIQDQDILIEDLINKMR